HLVIAVRYRQVQLAIAVDVADCDRIAIRADISSSNKDGRLESSVAVAEQYPGVGRTSGNEIEIAIAIEVTGNDKILVICQGVAKWRLESAVAVTEQNPELMSTDAGRSASNRYVQLPVMIEITNCYCIGKQSCG